MARAGAVVVAIALMAACGDDEARTVPRGRTDRAAAQKKAGPLVGYEAAPPIHRALLQPAKGSPASPRSGEPTGPDSPEAPEPAKAPEARDFVRELRTLLGDPVSCLGRGEELPDEVSVRVSVTVTGTGVVTRSEASGSSLSGPALACIRGRLENARFRAPVAAAPRTIHATIGFRRTPPPETQPAQAPEPQPAQAY